MALHAIPCPDKPYVSPYTSVGKEIVRNFYLEKSTTGSTKVPFYKVVIPGARAFRNTQDESILPATAAGRGIYTTSGGRTFGVADKYVYELAADSTISLLGTLRTATGTVYMQDNGEQLMLADGRDGWIYTLKTNKLERITDSQYPAIAYGDTNAPTHVVCIDTEFIANQTTTNNYYYSTAAYTPTSFDTTNPTEKHTWWGTYVGQKKGKPDNIVALASINNILVVFGQYTSEIHYNTKDESNQWTRQENAILNIGCRAPNSVCTFLNVVYWVAGDQKGSIGIYAMDGSYQPTKISERGIEQQMSEYADFSDAIGYTFSHSAHVFVAFYFPSADETWVYDQTSGTWCERTYLDQATGLDHAWRPIYATFNFGKLLTQCRVSSAVYELDTQYYLNDNPDGLGVNYINCTATSVLIQSGGVNQRFIAEQAVWQQGVGLTNNNSDGVGAEPTCLMSMSDDCGQTWSNELKLPIGKLGENTTRTRIVDGSWSRNRQFLTRCVDPVPRVFVGFYADIALGGN